MPTKTTSRLMVLWPIVTTWAIAIVCLVIYIFLTGQAKGDSLSVKQEDVGATLAFVWGGFLLFSVISVGLSTIFVVNGLKKTSDFLANAVDNLRSLRSGQTQQEAMLTQISENLLLSEAIKTIAFREKDRSVLEDAIHQDIQLEKWDSAELLVKDLSSRFGCPEEADKLRQEMVEFRSATIHEKIDKALSRIESLWSIHHYAEAEKQVANLQRMCPSVDKVKDLTGQTQLRREEHKRELLARWDESIRNNKVDESIEILELLDNYLSPTEAAALEESARGVFRAKLHNQGVQFSLFVTERKWDKALKIGRHIIDEFPNSRMAQEVREKLPILESKASA